MKGIELEGENGDSQVNRLGKVVQYKVVRFMNFGFYRDKYYYDQVLLLIIRQVNSTVLVTSSVSLKWGLV